MLWDIDFKSAIAQAELEDRERPAAFYRVAFRKPDGSPLYIETTRPELIAAIVAVVAHPEDERYQAHFGTTGRLPRSSRSSFRSCRIIWRTRRRGVASP